MTPEHHEERLCAWAEKTGRPVLSLDYGKAPECECNQLYLFYVRATARAPGLPSEFVAGMWEPAGSCAARARRMLCCDHLNDP